MTRLLLAALLAQVDAGPGLEALYAACPDAPAAVQLDGGWWLPTPRGERLACELAACEAFAVPRLEEPTPPGTVLALVGGGVALTVVAVLVGYLIPRPAPK